MSTWTRNGSVIGDDVRLGMHSIIGQEPMMTAANRRLIDKNLSCVRIGDRSVINSLVCIYMDVHMGEDCCVGNHASIREGARIGKRCVIGAHVDIQYNVEIGDDVRLLNQVQITGNSKIGDGTFIGPGVQTANDPFLFKFAPEDYQDRGQIGVTIGKFVQIGVGAIILPGVTIEDYAKIAAGSLVTRDVEAGSFMIGSPARPRVEPPWPTQDGDCAAATFAMPR